jgi:uncharacterized protein (DUF1800 family)
MGRHSGSAYDVAPDEWRPEDDGRDGGPDDGHNPLTRRNVLGILGVAGVAAACTVGTSVVANKPDEVPGDGGMPAGAPAKPVGLAAGAAGVTAPTSDKATAKAYDRTGYRSSKPPKIQPKPLLQRPTILSLDQDAHWLRRLTYGITAPALVELKALGRARWLEKQLTVDTADPLVTKVADRYPLLAMTPTQLKARYDADQNKPDDQKLDYLATEDQLSEMKIIRMVWSNNQLVERIHDTWAAFLHVPRGEKTRMLAADFDRTVIRRHLWNFADMLMAANFHPGMLVYLDQVDSNGNRKGDDGRPLINENYGRELLELFSVGNLDPITGRPNYDGRADVVQSALALTGMTVDRETMRYRFDPQMRYRGPVKVMGWRSGPNMDPAQGPKVIQSLIRYLAHHPATAKHIAEQFARAFVMDTPRPQLITAMAAAFTKAKTDIRPMIRVMVNSEDFRKAVGQKFRTPWEYVAATLRASRASLDPAAENAIDEKRGTFNGIRDLRYFIEQNGGLCHDRATPDGQPAFEAAWLSGKGMLDRWNLNSSVANGEWRGIKVPEAKALAGSAATQAQFVANLSQRLVGQQLQPGFTTAIHQFIGSASTSPASRVTQPAAVVRTVLSSPHMNYS